MGKKVIIIGSGVGGLATAVRLLSKGYDVTIYEKGGKIGGRVNLIENPDFKFDLTASILMSPKTYTDIFTDVNRNYMNYIEFLNLNPIYRVNYADGLTLDFHNDIPSLTKTLENISIDDTKGFIEFLAKVYEKYTIADKYFLQKSFDSSNKFFNLKSIAKALELHTFSTSYDYISKYIHNEKLREFLCFQCMYVGISPFDGPNIYTLIPMISQVYGLWQLKGGMYSYIKSLEKLIYEFNGTINTKTNVEEILFSGHNAIGVKTDKGIDKADIIVCNADFPYAMKNLIKSQQARGSYSERKINTLQYSCSTFIIYLGLKKKYSNLLVHNIVIGNNFKENIQMIFQGELPKSPSLYIYCPSSLDNTMCKDGYECLNIMVRVPNLLSNKVKWDKNTISNLRKQVFDALIKINGLQDIEDNILYESYITPQDIENQFNSYAGTAFGLSPTLTQTNYFRPHFKSEYAGNLYFVGSSIHPGPGVSLVLLSSKIVSEEILKNK